MLVPEGRVQKILFTPLLKYTDEIIKKAGVPISYRSFFEKSLYFTKLLKYVIKNRKIPKYGSPVARNNGEHNIKYMLDLMFKPKTPIYNNNRKYIIHKIDIHPTVPTDLRIGEPVSAKVTVYLAMMEDHKNNFDRLDCKDKKKDIMTSLHKFFYPDDVVREPDVRITKRGFPMLPPAYHSETTGYVKSKAINNGRGISSHARTHYRRGLHDIYDSHLSRHHRPHHQSRHHRPHHHTSRHHMPSASSASRHHMPSASSALRHHMPSASSASRHHKHGHVARGGGTKKKRKTNKRGRSTRCKRRRVV
uniref:Uncharacterized protein n=1 Tax=viral metagenome TaxID=1070528 RepID=A0A6C0BX94_9ZZZZ